MRDVNYGWFSAMCMPMARPCSLLRFIYICSAAFITAPTRTTRSALDARRCDLPVNDGNSVYGLRSALGSDVLLGRDGYHKPLLSDPVDW